MKLIEFLAEGNDSLKVMFSTPQTNSLLVSQDSTFVIICHNI